MTRPFALLLVLFALATTPLAAQQPDSGFDAGSRLRSYGGTLIDPFSWGSVAASTLLDQIRDDPDEWQFSDRALSNAGRFILEESIYHGIAALQDRSTWYHPCPCRGAGARAGHAFAEAFTDYDRTGGAHLSTARIVAPYGSAMAEALWRPGRSFGDAIMAGSTSLVFSGLFNIVREFVR